MFSVWGFRAVITCGNSLRISRYVVARLNLYHLTLWVARDQIKLIRKTNPATNNFVAGFSIDTHIKDQLKSLRKHFENPKEKTKLPQLE